MPPPEKQIDSSSNDSPLPYRGFVRKILIIILFALMLLVAWQGAEILLIVFAGLLLAIFLRGLSDFIRRYTPLSDSWALGLVLIAIVGAVTLGAWLLAPSVHQQFGELSDTLPDAYEQARERLSQSALGRKIAAHVPAPPEIVFGRQSGNIFGRVTGFFSSAFNAAANILIVLMTAVYFGFSSKTYYEGVLRLVPPKRERRAREILDAIHQTLRKFLLGISCSMTINGTLTFLGLWFLDIPFAVPLGILAGLLSFVPNIGPLIAAAPAVLIAFSQSPAQAFYIGLIYLGVQNLDGYLITPLVQQRAVAVPPVVVITAQLLLAVLFGFLGLLVAVPLAAVISVLIRMIYVEDILGRRADDNGEKNV